MHRLVSKAVRTQIAVTQSTKIVLSFHSLCTNVNKSKVDLLLMAKKSISVEVLETS
jgi:hypothetical protein